ncbi:MAG: hypothetical protein GXP53_13800 [Deltaproteobacteria bacterium]|nr:hypothetical protein [Deltaproteobacteria bacterium]
MHLIKKYTNRKLYDTNDKQYITMEKIAELIKSGVEVMIIDNESGDDLTAKLVSQLLGREKKETGKALPSSVLMQMLRKGRGTLFGYGRKYVSLWQNAFTMSKDEIERLINTLVRDKEISESEGKNLKNEIVSYTSGVKNWILENIDQSVTDALAMMNLASRDQVNKLTKRVDSLSRKVISLEKEIRGRK